MDFKLANSSSDSEKSGVITLKQIEKEMAEGSVFYYLDKSNKEKDLKDLINKINSKGKKAIYREVCYGIGEDEYIYEIVIV